ncbi:hypothetical protein [Novosphingobium sp. BL-52-GroH]|uniref:hypothetical protein n=1 Tax=Novosphingobium sp. BL-52-GroH TaxID=3349877 RepID=UPI00384EEA85
MTDVPQTYAEALEKGYQPVLELQILQEKDRHFKLKEFLEAKDPCAVGQVGPCFDWTSLEGVRTLCYCREDGKCSDCVQKHV